MNYDVNAYTGNHAKQYYGECQKEYHQHHLEKEARQHVNKSPKIVKRHPVLHLLMSLFNR